MDTRFRRLMILIGVLLAVDITVVGIYFGARLQHATPAPKLLLGMIWSMAVLAVIGWGGRWVRHSSKPPPSSS